MLLFVLIHAFFLTMFQAHQQYMFYDDDHYVDPFNSSFITGTNPVVIPVPDDAEG